MTSFRPQQRLTAALTLGAGLFFASVAPGHAAAFLPSYTGPSNQALDLNSIGVSYNGSVFDLTSTSNAAISTAPAGSLFVWGVNRGAGTARFDGANAPGGAIGSNVLFDAVLLINPTGATKINLFNGTVETVPTADITIAGNTIAALIPSSLLPGTGLSPHQYGFDLWPRVGAGNNQQIAQFFGTTNATNPTDVQPVAVPEPTSWVMLATALGLLIVTRRKRPLSRAARVPA